MAKTKKIKTESLVKKFKEQIQLIQEKTGINVMIAQDTVSCVALGTGKALDTLDMLDGKQRN